jgi:uncharacterized protein
VSPASVLPGWLSDALGSLAAGDIDGWMQVYAPDAVHEFPFAPDGAVRRLEGRDEIAAYMSRLPQTIRFGTISNVRVREAGDELIIEADGHHRRIADDTPLDLRYIWFITVRAGRVSHFRDYMGAAHS